jgi:hypothetical protein
VALRTRRTLGPIVLAARGYGGRDRQRTPLRNLLLDRVDQPLESANLTIEAGLQRILQPGIPPAALNPR